MVLGYWPEIDPQEDWCGEYAEKAKEGEGCGCSCDWCREYSARVEEEKAEARRQVIEKIDRVKQVWVRPKDSKI
jgi:hypothetical protein